MVGREPEVVERAHTVLEAVGSDVRQNESSKQIPVTLLELLITIKTSPNKAANNGR